MLKIIKYIVVIFILTFIIFAAFSFIDYFTAVKISSTGFGGCYIRAVRETTFLLFPFKEPFVCAWHPDDALINLPYHLFISCVIVFIFWLIRKNRKVF
jgi:hypothetical protein